MIYLSRERMQEAKEELDGVLSDDRTRDTTLLVFNNKVKVSISNIQTNQQFYTSSLWSTDNSSLIFAINWKYEGRGSFYFVLLRLG